ncbi:MAG: hypothetical protein AMJ81_00945 [Phycisphaerae bacterium SM23_33]|nr:MAG: hypothetical protein AMJ81_00945 [Phycisphaerae bacterium SM23_33]
MSTNEETPKHNVKASDLLPEDMARSMADQKKMMSELLRKEERSFRQRKVATLVYWILALGLFAVPVLAALWWGDEMSIREIGKHQTFLVISWLAAFVLFIAAFVSTISLLVQMIRRRPVRDAQILAALYQIDATLQKLARDGDNK